MCSLRKWTQKLAPPPSLPHIDSGLTQNPLDGLISLNSLRASTTSCPSRLAASGTALCKAPKTQLHRSSPWPSEILTKGKVREAKEDRAAPPLPRSLLEMETKGKGNMTARGGGNTHHFEVCPPGSQATLKINKAFKAGSPES